MQKGLIGILGILVLFLAAANVRLSTRTRLLEEQFATAAKRPASASAPLPAPSAVEASAQSPSVSVPAAAVVKTPEPNRADPWPAPVSVPQQSLRLEEARLTASKRIYTLQAIAAPASASGVQLAAPQDPDAGARPRSAFLGIMGVDGDRGGEGVAGVV